MPLTASGSGGSLISSLGGASADGGGVGRLEGVGGYLQAFEWAEFDVFVFDVDRHVGVDAFERLQEPRPKGGVVAAADGDEVPCRILGPLVHHMAPSEPGRILAQWDSGEPLIEDTVDLAVLVDPGVLGGGVVHQWAQPFDRGDRVDALPEQVRRVHLRANVGGTDTLDEPP